MRKYVELRVHQAIHVVEANGATQKFGLGADKQTLVNSIIEKVDGGFIVFFKEGSGYFISDNNVVWARYIDEPKNTEGIKSGIALDLESKTKRAYKKKEEV